MRLLHASITLAAVALALGGCTSAGSSSAGNFKGDENAVAKVVDDLQAAGRSGKPDKVCNDIFTKELAAKFAAGSSTCVDEVEKAMRDVSDFNLKVTDVTVDGTTATAKVEQGKEKAAATLTFEKVGGDWRASSLSG